MATLLQGTQQELESTKLIEEIDQEGILEVIVDDEQDKINNVLLPIQRPEIGKIFDSDDEMFAYYKEYAFRTGFPVKRRTSKKGDDGVLRYVTFACGRSGNSTSTSSNPLKPQPNTKMGCKTRIGGSLMPDEKWRLNSVSSELTHGLSPGKSRYYRCNRVISSRVKRQLVINDKAGIRSNKNFNSFVVEAGGHENLPFLEKDFRNFLDNERRLRLGEGDAMALQSYFLKKQSQNTGFFFSMDLDEEGRLKNVFWADSRSRAAYKEFGEVITFDTTYLTNKYDMPFAPFVGVNHHGQSTLLGYGLVSREDTNTFVWLFRTWLACMSDCPPSGIITDQALAMKKAIEIVFPNARHRWCLWHIMNKISTKLGAYAQYKSISFAFRSLVYDSQSSTDFENGWSTFMDEYELQDNTWLSGLYDERERWVPTFVKHKFWAGMSTTQRSESMNAFFDGYVHSKTTLKQFVEQYDNALMKKVENEAQADFRSFSQQIPCVTNYDMEQQIQGLYTISKFKEFQNELIGKMYCEFTGIKEDCIVYDYEIREDVVFGEGLKKRVFFKVSFNKFESEVKCSCSKFEFKGILCRHAITVLIRNDMLLLPENYIIRRWRKNVNR